MSKDLLTLGDLTADEIRVILERAHDLKMRQRDAAPHRLLEGKTVAMIFEKPSLRTRATFEIGIYQLGGHALNLDLKLGERESIPDIARNLERWVDGIVARVHAHAGLVELAGHASVPVVNALSDDYHPCQILADAQTIIEYKESIENIKLAFVGDGNNVFASWAMFAAKIPFELVLACPEGFELDENIAKAIKDCGGKKYTVTDDPAKAAADADVVYTDVWTSMGQEAERQQRLEAFKDYQVTQALMKKAKPDALFMHCLPAHRGEEVVAEVIDGPQSVVFDEAENRLHAQKAVLARLLGA